MTPRELAAAAEGLAGPGMRPSMPRAALDALMDRHPDAPRPIAQEPDHGR